MEIEPPIENRSTEELIGIIESHEQWRPEVYQLAQEELTKRGVSLQNQSILNQNKTKNNKRVKQVKSKAGYTLVEKLLITFLGPLSFIFFHNIFAFYKGDGFDRMNRQGLIYFLIGIILWGTTLYITLK